MNYTKFTKSQVMAVFRHCARENKNFSNENIDLSRTHENYDLGPGGNQWGRMEDRLKDLAYRKQKNNTVLCSWVITAPKNLPEEKQKQFFKVMYDFMCKKYGRENVVSAYVHMDEKTPHMHFLYVPGTQDLKLSAKRTTTRETLQHIHDEAQKVIDKSLGHEYLMRADDPAERAKKSVPVQQMKKALDHLETQREFIQIENDFSNEQIKNQDHRINDQKKEIKKLQNQKETYHALSEAYRQDVDSYKAKIQEQKRIIAKNDKTIQEQSETLARGSRMAQKLPQLEQRVNDLQRQKNALQSDIRALVDVRKDFIERMEDIAIHGDLARRELQSSILNGNISHEIIEGIQNEINEGTEAKDILQSLDYDELGR